MDIENFDALVHNDFECDLICYETMENSSEESDTLSYFEHELEQYRVGNVFYSLNEEFEKLTKDIQMEEVDQKSNLEFFEREPSPCFPGIHDILGIDKCSVCGFLKKKTEHDVLRQTPPRIPVSK